jgi:hypothetical protein
MEAVYFSDDVLLHVFEYCPPPQRNVLVWG